MAEAQPDRHYLRWFWNEVAEEVREEVKRRYGYTVGDSGLGKLVLSNYAPFVPLVGKAYEARPDFEPEYLYSWKALAKHIDTMFRRLQSRVNIEFTEEDPYPSYVEMVQDIRRGHMFVYTGHSEHPAFSPQENWRFRAVHDYLAHAGGEHTFSLRGEMAAYNRHVKVAPPTARLALFTEIVGQTCCYFWNDNKFCTQKVCKLWGFDYENVGDVDKVEYERNFES